MQSFLSARHSRSSIALVVMAFAAALLFLACGDDREANPAPFATKTTRGSENTVSIPEAQPAAATPTDTPPMPSAPVTDGSATDGGEQGTPPNLKVAFLADTSDGSGYKDVLALVKREKANLVLLQGDLTYRTTGTPAASWLAVTDAELDDATGRVPFFVARGNHDVDWSTLGSGLKNRLATWGVVPQHNDPTLGNYSLVYKGLKIVFVDESETSNPTRADYVKERLEGDPHLWKICSWHKNMRDSNAGGKGDEMGWQIYENCRQAGAFVAQGHSHTYSRSKTLVADASLTVDPACKDPFSLCVGPGKHFFFDNSLGGVGLRPLVDADKPHWASTYSADYGALFVEFHVDGDPRKAKAYFKTVNDVVVDPPASSGKAFFTITSSN